MRKSLKEEVENSINSALQSVEDVLTEVKDVEDESEGAGDFSCIYKYLDDLKNHINDIDGTFYDFSNKVDKLRDELNELL